MQDTTQSGLTEDMKCDGNNFIVPITLLRKECYITLIQSFIFDTGIGDLLDRLTITSDSGEGYAIHSSWIIEGALQCDVVTCYYILVWRCYYQIQIYGGRKENVDCINMIRYVARLLDGLFEYKLSISDRPLVCNLPYQTSEGGLRKSMSITLFKVMAPCKHGCGREMLPYTLCI